MDRHIYLAGGCFWGTEKYLSLITGVSDTDVGYANGNTENPGYEDVCHNNTGHAEAVHVVYNDEELSLEGLLDLYYEVIDPTSLNKQGGDTGSQYRTGIYYTDPADRTVIEESIKKLQKKYSKDIVVEILPLNNYYRAEEYHQKYLDKNPGGYCHIPPEMLRSKVIPQEHDALLARIDSLKAELSKKRPLTQGELKRLRDEFIVEFTYNSNAIEGNTLTLRETALVLEGITIDKKPLKDHLEAVGHRDAFLYIQQIVGETMPISEKIIKDIHSLVLMDRPEDKGSYRRIPVKIMGACHEPPQPYLVPVQMERLVAEQTTGKYHPIENAALFHLDFEGIHPFIDGNGRTGRLILNLMLMRHGYPPIDVKFADRKRYYSCFDSYYKDKMSRSMVTMVAEYIEERLKRHLEILSVV